MTTPNLQQQEPTFRLVNGRPTWTITLDAEATTAGATEIPDVNDLTLPEAAARYREYNLAAFPWRLIDGGKNLGAFVGTGYHKLAAQITPAQARELCELDENVTGLGLSAGRSGLIIFDLDRPELCPPLLRRAIEETNPPYQVTRTTETPEGLLPRGHYVFRVPAGRRMGSPTKWTGENPGSLNWGEVRSWNSGIAVGPGQHPKPEGLYKWARTGAIPELPDYLAETLPEFVISAEPATDAERRKIREVMTRRTDPAAVGRIRARHGADGSGLEGRHGATLYVALDLAREMVAGRIDYDDFTNGVADFFYELVNDPSRRGEPDQLCRWALGQVMSDAAEGKVPGLANAGVDTELPEGTDVSAVGARTLRTAEIYKRRAGRPIGMADDIQRKVDLLRQMTRRVFTTAEAAATVSALDEHLVPVLVDWSALGSLRAGSTPEKAAEYREREDAFKAGVAAAVKVCAQGLQAEVAAYVSDGGSGVRLDRATASKWAELSPADVATAIVRGYKVLFAATALPTPNHDAAVEGDLSDSRKRHVIGHLTSTILNHAMAIAGLVDDDEAPPLPQPAPATRVPICLDDTALRIDGVNTFLNTWSPNPDDVAGNGDLFMFRGRPSLYTRRGGQLDEAREIKHLGHVELIALTNERADVYETDRDGQKVVSELSEINAKVGLASVRRTLARTLVEVAATPILTPDNTLVPDAVYDTDTGVLVACETPFELAPERPTAAQVNDALQRLDDFYGDFSFMGEGDRAAFWAYLFTVPLRRKMNGRGWLAVPALGIRAGKANAGKTLLSEAIGGLHGAVSRRLPEGEEELRKTILSAYESRPSAQVLILNNIPNGHVLDSAALAEIVTEPVVEGRRLGFTGEDITHPNNKILVVNGNRWRPHDDLVSRVIPLGVKPVVGADNRVFRTPDLEARVRTPEHHAEVLHLLHIVLRAWIAEGSPVGDDHGIRGNFSQWAKTIDGVLAYAGIKGFGTNFEKFADMEENPDEDFLAVLVELIGMDKFFSRADVETLLIDTDALTKPADRWKAKLADCMPRDARMSSVAGNGKRAPMSGNKLSRMLNAQVDLPIKRGEDGPYVTLTTSAKAGVKGYRFGPM